LGMTDYGDWLYALHVGALSSNHHSAIVGGIEFGIPTPQFRFQSSKKKTISEIEALQPTAFIGFELRGPAPYTSHSFTLRTVVELPQVDIAVGPYLNLAYLENGVTSRYRWAYGGRAELGFSIVSLYVAVGEEPFLENPLKTVRGFGISTGFTCVLNGRRLWNNTIGRL
jgi:hypothetical protein